VFTEVTLSSIVAITMPNKNDDLKDLLQQRNFNNRDVAFLFSELRKIIESSDKKYKTLKFYCDWLLHSQKDCYHPEMKLYIREIYESAVKHIQKPMQFEYSKKISDLIYFEILKNDLSKILNDSNLSEQILEDESWLNLVRVLVKLLENQPLIKPIEEVSSIVFSPAVEGAAIMYINFSEPVNDWAGTPHHYYKMVNYY